MPIRMVCNEAFDEWDDCMRAKDDGLAGDGSEGIEGGTQSMAGRNLCEESFVSYKTGLCLCFQACQPGVSEEVRETLKEQANRELMQASEFWDRCKAFEDGDPGAEPPIPGCGMNPLGWPLFGTPPDTPLPGFGDPATGPPIDSCECPLELELTIDPCQETRIPGEG